MSSRPDWDSIFFASCALFAQRSPDPNTRLGAVIVRPNKTVVSTGYNGLPRGVEHKPERLVRPLKSWWMVHAEENAMDAAREPLDGYTLYVPIMPCMRCARQAVQKGIAEVVCDAAAVEAYSSPEYSEQFGEVRKLFDEVGVRLRMWPTK